MNEKELLKLFSKRIFPTKYHDKIYLLLFTNRRYQGRKIDRVLKYSNSTSNGSGLTRLNANQ